MMRAAAFLLLGACDAYHLPYARAPAPVATVAVSSADVKAAAPLKPPQNREDMLTQAASAVQRARADDVNRCLVRVFLTKEDGNLYPPDESWEGGIMQLYKACTPLVRDLLRRISTEVAGVPPALTEQRLDESGVDGESVWFAQSNAAKDDCVGLVQPSAERLETIRTLSAQSGERLLMLVNPQWKERDDPLDALSRKAGLGLGLGLGFE